MLENDANINIKNDDGSTSLMICACTGQYSEIVELLISYGADINATDKNGWTALMFASQNGYVESVKILLQYNADVNIQNKDRMTALMLIGYDNN